MLGRIGKGLLPDRWNEGISLQHCKAYLFDDSVVIRLDITDSHTSSSQS